MDSKSAEEPGPLLGGGGLCGARAGRRFSLLKRAKGQLSWLTYQGIGAVLALPVVVKLLIRLLTRCAAGDCWRLCFGGRHVCLPPPVQQEAPELPRLPACIAVPARPCTALTAASCSCQNLCRGWRMSGLKPNAASGEPVCRHVGWLPAFRCLPAVASCRLLALPASQGLPPPGAAADVRRLPSPAAGCMLCAPARAAASH